MSTKVVLAVMLVIFSGCGQIDRNSSVSSDTSGSLASRDIDAASQLTEPGGPHKEGNDLADAPSAIERTLTPTKVKFFYKDYAKDPDYRSYEADDFVLADLPTSVFPLRDTMLLYHARIVAEEEERVSNPASEVKTELPRWRNFKLLDVRLEGTKAILTFEDPDFYTSGGSARVFPMRNGYIETAIQFREVEEVEILPLDVFQP